MQVLKLGGSILTQKEGYAKADTKNIKALAKMLGKVWKDGINEIVLIHGAGSFGHPQVVKYNLNDGVHTPEQKIGAAETHLACSNLSNLLVDALIEEGVPAVSLPPALLGKLENRRLVEFHKKAVTDLLELGYLPVLYGDMMPDSKLGCAVCSGDQLVSFFGKDAERIILGTNVDGVLAEGQLVSEINSANFKEVSGHFKDPGYTDVTGGMKGKINELLGLGVSSYIVNAEHPDRIKKLLEGETDVVCTLVK